MEAEKPIVVKTIVNANHLMYSAIPTRALSFSVHFVGFKHNVCAAAHRRSRGDRLMIWWARDRSRGHCGLLLVVLARGNNHRSDDCDKNDHYDLQLHGNNEVSTRKPSAPRQDDVKTYHDDNDYDNIQRQRLGCDWFFIVVVRVVVRGIYCCGVRNDDGHTGGTDGGRSSGCARRRRNC